MMEDHVILKQILSNVVYLLTTVRDIVINSRDVKHVVVSQDVVGVTLPALVMMPKLIPLDVLWLTVVEVTMRNVISLEKLSLEECFLFWEL
jgi:hypothetical protein